MPKRNFVYPYPDVCKSCGKRYSKYHPKQTQCRTCNSVRALTTPLVDGYYTYGWYIGDSDLPYYVGKGLGDRGWRSGRLPPSTKVRIYQHGMSEAEALLVESTLITVFLSLGAHLINKRIPTKPVVIPEVKYVPKSKR